VISIAVAFFCFVLIGGPARGLVGGVPLATGDIARSVLAEPNPLLALKKARCAMLPPLLRCSSKWPASTTSGVVWGRKYRATS
jgi:hypothetical protein